MDHEFPSFAIELSFVVPALSSAPSPIFLYDGWEDGCRRQRQASQAKAGDWRGCIAAVDDGGGWEGARQRMMAARR